MTQRYHNEHYIHVSSGVATNEQFAAHLQRVLQERKLSTRFKINLIHLGGKPIGYGYLWVQEPEIYNMLIGNNPDGTERFQELDDPTWRPPSPQPEKTMAEIMDECKGRNWADI